MADVIAGSFLRRSCDDLVEIESTTRLFSTEVSVIAGHNLRGSTRFVIFVRSVFSFL